MSPSKFIAAAVVGGLALCSAGAAGASSTSTTAPEVLDELCESRGGLPVNSPYAIARCQGARANKGFETERLICEGIGDAAFLVTISERHMNRAAWACVSTVPVA
jgi:hypothetical protein